MTHPEELLAPYVDDALSVGDRTVVDEHLSTCARCRLEVELAGAARDLLISIPAAEPAPGIGAAALREAAEGRSASLGPAPTTGQRWSRLAGVAAVAAVLGLVALALPRLGSSEGDERAAIPDVTSEAAVGPEGTDAPGDVALEVVASDYSLEDVKDLATTYAAERERGDDSAAATQSAPLVTPDKVRTASSSRAVKAVVCLHDAFRGFSGEPSRLIRASFQGRPAYLGLVPERAGAGRPADTLSVWVASIEDCSILSFTQIPL